MISHLPEYLIEAVLLGAFMIAACIAVVSVQHPRSPVRARVKHPVARRAIIGVWMGLTAITLIYSPLGQRSGAHMNPAVTLTFLALGRVQPMDALGYIAAQFAGGVAGVYAARLALGRLLVHEQVRFATTEPGGGGAVVAWVAEFAIAAGLMSLVLWFTNTPNLAPYTGLFAGLLVALYITVEAPLSGMSMNPARSLASAVHARSFRALWVYFTAPPLAMLAAAGLYVGVRGFDGVRCCKLQHPQDGACIFKCRMNQMEDQPR